MLLTEEGARTKWCPQARVFDVSGTNSAAAINRYDEDVPSKNNGADEDSLPPSARCVGSNCMAWRWGDCHPTETVDVIETPTPGLHRRVSRPIQRGYCGLAGRTE